MTEKTFFKWINRYTKAKMELAAVGSRPTVIEQEEAKVYWTQKYKEARKKLLFMWLHFIC